MFAVDACDLPETGGSTFGLIAGLFVLVAGVIVARWVRQSAGRMSVVVAPLVLLGGLVLAPQVTDPCAPSATTTVPPVTTVAATNSTVPSATTTVPSATTTTTVAPTTTTLAPVVYQVGQAGPGGGIIFYKDLQRAAGSQYFEVACAGWSDGICGGNDLTDPQAVWGCQGTLIAGADGTAIGTGAQNTTDIVNIVGGCSTSGIAADLANDLTLGGQSDWFLPSKDELNQMYTNLHSASTPIGGFLAGNYWSSSEEDDIWVRLQFFDTGSLGSSLKAGAFYVRPVRAF